MDIINVLGHISLDILLHFYDRVKMEKPLVLWKDLDILLGKEKGLGS